MRKDLVVIPDDRPGMLARLAQALADAGINVEACSAVTGGGKGIVHLLVDDDVRGIEVLAEAGFEVKAARRVAVTVLENRPGALAEACHALEDAGVNIEQCYFANGDQFVVVADDIDGAKAALGITP